MAVARRSYCQAGQPRVRILESLIQGDQTLEMRPAAPGLTSTVAE